MGLSNKTSLLNSAGLIRNAQAEGFNTAERVGRMFVEFINAVDTSTGSIEGQISTLQQTVNTAAGIANNAYTESQTAKQNATKAQSTADAAKSIAEAAKAVTDSKGQPNGIVPLDAAGLIASRFLPGYVDDVVEFNAMVEGITPQMASINKRSTDSGCLVVYCKDTNRFVLAVSNVQVSENEDWNVIRRPIKSQLAVSPAAEGATSILSVKDYWTLEESSSAVLRPSAFTYYNNWLDAYRFGENSDINGRIPDDGKIYTCTSDNKTFRWSGSELITIGSDLALGYTASTAFPGDEGLAVKNLAEGVQIFPFHAICYHPDSELADRPDGTIAFAADNHIFVFKQGGTWIQHPTYNVLVNGKPHPKPDVIYRLNETLYVCRLTEGGYYYPEAYVIGMEAFNEIKETVSGIAILPFEGIIPYAEGINIVNPQSGIWFYTLKSGFGYFVGFGKDEDSNHYLGSYNDFAAPDAEAGYVAREDKIFRRRNELYRFDGTKLVKVGGASVGNTFNVTVEKPLNAGEYYSDIKSEIQTHNVLDAVINAGYKSLGLTITFAIGAGSWKTYQYIGPNTSDAQFRNVANWIDLAGMSAGAEAIINVDALCPRLVAGYYTKDTAIDAILALQQSSGIKYAKGGLVITFRSGEYTFEAYQFTGQPDDFASKELWKEFGGGGSVRTSDTSEKGGHDAFSTGGAYEMEQKQFDHLDIDQDAENHIIKAINKHGDEMGDPIKLPKSTGSGQQTGSTLTIFVENAAVYGAYGSNITTRVAVKSVSYDGDNEILGMINRLEIIDTTTGLTLFTDNSKLNASATSTSWLYTLDFSPYFTEAAQRDFTIVAYDADGNVKRRTITVTAVDVTCTCVQALNYTSANALAVNGDTKNINMYKFANNVSQQGVKVTTELFFEGEWRVLGVATITDSYTHSISINPTNVFGGGEKMTHGAYPIRISGQDVASGVKGNTVYTAVMCIDSASTKPVVALRFNDVNNGTIRLYENLTLEVAAYTPGKNETEVTVVIDGVEVLTTQCQISKTETVRKQVQGYPADGSKTIEAFAKSTVGGEGAGKYYTVVTNTVSVKVLGSAISAQIKEGARFSYDFASRSNSESNHVISDGGITMDVIGSNWSSNGFCSYLGEMSLRIAENVKAIIPYAPFGSAATERTNGMALQFAFATNNVKDEEAKLMECYDPDSGAGFYICGNKFVMMCKTGTPSVLTRPFRCGEKHTVGIVVEPSTITQHRGSTEYSTIKFYFDGEECGAIGYIANSGAILNQRNITFDGSDADFYLYYLLAYDSYYEWAQAFQNYLCKLTDTSAMTEEFDKEDVLDNQNRPSLDKLKEKGMPYYVVVAPEATFTSFDSDINTSTNFKCTLFYYDPAKPWRSFKAENVRWRRQGTTSAKRPIKNDRFYLAKEKNWKITPLYPDYQTEEAQRAYNLMKLGYVQVGDNTIPVKIITVKVDYSDSTNANDCGVCDMMNATFRMLGSSYMTPAQRAFDGTWKKGDITVTGLEMNHSTANHPIAAFRATSETLVDAYFHAKGNWKEDKGEQVALGFKDTPGYNKGCLNYGDFIEFFGEPDETLDQTMARFKKAEGLDTSKPYLLSQYCGRDYRIMRFSGGEWARSNGSMKQVNGKWQITGDVLNPVSGYELITYDAMDWFMGVGSVADMMAPTATMSSWVSKLNLGQETYPAWTQYFECMIDDDQLQIDLAMGRKVPFELFNVLKFCDSCDYSKAALASTWKSLWSSNAWKYMSIQSLIAYYAFTDYLAAVDQQAKNMQPMFLLEDGCWVENGVYHSPSAMEPVRMYFNKVYDCDTCNGKDNDGGNTIPADLNPEEDDKCYAGRGSILWNNLRRCDNQEMVADANGNTLTLPGVVATMRNLPEIDGIGAGPFSPKGAHYYFLTKRILRWPKQVSSFDGERKYIKYTGYNDIYYYALQGSGRQSLPAFIEQRWRVRDGYYQTGDFKDASHVLGGRIGAKSGAVIKFRAAKSGYFGVGNDGGNVTQGMYLKAGEQGTFTQFQHGDNILLYIYQADQMSEIDLSQISLDPNFQFSQMKLAEKIVIGSANHRQSWRLSPGNTGFLTNMNLGDLPFLKHLDVRTTEVTAINGAKCPRLETVLASGSDLTSITTAETSPISKLELPGGMTELNLVNLPNLTFPGGLTVASMANVNKLMLAGCPNIDPMALINGIVTSSNIRYIRLPNINITAPSSILSALKSSGAIGLDPDGNAYEESGQCSGLIGRWIFSDLVDDKLVDKNFAGSYAKYFPQLEIHNAQYSYVEIDDTENDSQNYTNPDNGTYGDNYEPTGHFKRIEETSHVYKCTYNNSNPDDPFMELEQISDSDYGLMADGTEFDPSDNAGVGYDIMKKLDWWYKGVNDYKNQKKYYFVSSLNDTPMSTAAVCKRVKLSDCLRQALACVYSNNLSAGDSYAVTENANHNCYEVDVDGMKQVRWPGVNSAQVGAVFVDADDKVVGTFNMSVGHALFDFVLGDYVFCDVPKGAKKLIFTSPTGFDDLECIAVDSDALEAIEPDWCHTRNDAEACLLGVYAMTVDALMRPRSISGQRTKRGDGTSTTNPDWKYDNVTGRVSNPTVPTSTMHYTYQDFMNICEVRGKGYQAIDYEMSKDVANMAMALVGDRDIQAQCGYGCSSDHITGANNANSFGNVTRRGGSTGSLGNIIFGIQNFVACTYEWMDNVAVNVPSYLQFKKDKRVANNAYPIDVVWHIYNPVTMTERTVQGINSSGYCIGRVKHGRHCDVIASRVTSDNSKWNMNYTDVQYYTHDRGRVVGRAYSNAHASGGLVYSNASYVSSNSYAYYGSRLAFRGKVVIKQKEAA